MFNKIIKNTSMPFILLFIMNGSGFFHKKLYAQKVFQREELIRFSGGKPSTFDPTNVDDKPTTQLLQDLYEGLTRIDKDGKVVLAIASSYKIENNNKTYIFKIRPNAKWSDGSAVTAEHCALSIKRIINPKISTTIGFSAFPIKNSREINQGKLPISKLGVKTLNSDTIVIDLSYPFPHFLELLSGINYVCLNPKSYDAKGNFISENPIISNSAYKIKKIQNEKYIEFEKNPYYYNFDKVKIKDVLYYFTEDMLSQINMYITGQANMTSPNISSDDIPYLTKKSAENNLKSNKTLDVILLTLNTKKKPFKNNLKLRKAISMVIDRSELSTKILSNPKLSIYDLVPNHIEEYKSYIPNWAKKTYEERVIEAKKLFSEAGFSENNKLSIQINYNLHPDNHKIAIAISNMLKNNLGINVILNRQEFKENITKLRKGDFEISLNRWYPKYIDAIEYLGILVSTNQDNYSFMKDPKFDALIEKAGRQTENSKRTFILEQAGKKGLENYTVIPLLDNLSHFLINYDLAGYTGNDPYLKLYSQDLYFKEIIIK
ncbi:hypothetical protein GCL60_05735 [Silvanigrella paludirubra]|uniref:Solute-binding protein family 5 domain-containing protein n=1 Tax=Silvanigrella paludirubra TaxID=2499159 RepID=A0A6N6VV76_9BACT|nr:peptide ABC transporter substrate-binding protein [Silvanigrella paludirubra]KAB8039764.1 hypothetical protein GCL60_05735 [Silvanigrella paludirubra]